MAGEGTGWAFGVLMRAPFPLFLLLLAGCDQPSDGTANSGNERAVLQASVPLKYRGEWTNEQKYCGYDGDDLDSRLIVTEGSVGFFESQHNVSSVIEAGSGLEIEYKPNPNADLLAPEFLRLAPDGQRIFTSDDAASKGYARCPQAGR